MNVLDPPLTAPRPMLISKLFGYVFTYALRHRIDESHGLSHSMNTLYYAHQIFKTEVKLRPQIQPQERMIYTAAILHDMCDAKYTDKSTEIARIDHFLQDKLTDKECEMTKAIVSSMSYSHVTQHGFPQLGDYQTAYHIVREADLLTAYDVDRSIVFHMHTKNATTYEAYTNARKFFMERVFLHNEHKLFYTEYGRKQSVVLHEKTLERLWFWKTMIDYDLYGFTDPP